MAFTKTQSTLPYSKTMQVIYFERFIPISSSEIPATTWKKIDTFLESNSKIVQKIKERGYCIDLQAVEEGTFIYRYELAQ